MNLNATAASIPNTQKAFRLFLLISIGIHLAALFYQNRTLLLSPAVSTKNLQQSFRVQLQEEKQEKKAIAKPQKKVVKKPLIKKKTLKKKEVIKKVAKEEVIESQKRSTMAFESSIKNFVKPRYPRLAIRRGIIGEVKLELFVKGDGQIQKVLLTKSSGHAMLDDSALEAAKQWVFKKLSENKLNVYKVSKTLVFKIN